MRGRGSFQLAQMRRSDPRVIELCDHLRAAVDLLERMATESMHSEPRPAPAKEVRTLRIVESDNIAFSVREASRLLGIGRATLYVAMSEGKIPAVKFGKRTLIPAQGLRDWFDSLPAR